MMATGIANLIDLVIGITVVEAALLVAFHRATGRGVAPGDFLMNLVSGLFLMLALRCLASQASDLSVALCLLGAGLAHAADLARRWRSEPRARTGPSEVLR